MSPRGPRRGRIATALLHLVVASLSWTAADAWAQAAPDGLDPAAELVAELVERARDGSLDAAWVDAHVLPRGTGWSRTAQEAWARALQPGGPLITALQRSSGIVTVHREAGPTRVVLDGSPALGFLVLDALPPPPPTPEGTEPPPAPPPGPRIVAVEATTCLDCDERTRFVRDLLSEIRRRGALGERLHVGLEIDVRGWLTAHEKVDGVRWSEGLDRWLRLDAEVADVLSRATVVGREGDDVVRVAYADGRSDTWRIRWSDTAGWRIAYDGLAADSPLAFTEDDLAAWRKPETPRDVALSTWRPAWRLTADGAGRALGSGAVGAAFDPVDGSVVLAAVSADRTVSALLRVDPETGGVLQRIPVPLFSEDARWPAGRWSEQWRMALSPDGAHVALSLPDGVSVITLATGASTAPVRAPASVTALEFDADGQVMLGLVDGRLIIGRDTWGFADAGAVLAIADTPTARTLVTSGGQVWQIAHSDGVATRVHVACEGAALDAAFRPRDGTWLVACPAAAPHAHELVPWLPGPRYVYAGVPAGSAGTAWSGDGSTYTTPGADGRGVWVWEDLHRHAILALGREALRDAALDSAGEHALALTTRGDVVVWDLLAARRHHAIPRPPSTRGQPR